MLHALFDLFAFLAAISILIAVHEYGHFWMARRLGIKVLCFSIGFGKPLVKWRDKKGTEFCIAWIPLGGFVRMLDEQAGAIPEAEQPFAMNRQPVWARIAVVLAGPISNFLFAFVVFALVFSLGITSSIPIVGMVKPDSIAAKAGIREGDEIVGVDGVKTTTWGAIELALLKRMGDTGYLDMTVRHKSPPEEKTHRLLLDDWQVDPEITDPLDNLGINAYLPYALIVDKVTAGGPAAAAGLQVGDKIESIDAQPVVVLTDMQKELQKIIPGKAVTVQVLRNNQHLSFSIVPVRKIVGQRTSKKPVIGVFLKPELPPDWKRHFSYTPWEAVSIAAERTWHGMTLTLQMLYKMVVGRIHISNLSGPIAVAEGAGVSAQVGFKEYCVFLAYISISLGVINALPIPILDGGYVLYYLIEWVRGRPLSNRSQVTGFQIGLFILLVVMIVAFYNDIARLYVSS